MTDNLNVLTKIQNKLRDQIVKLLGRLYKNPNINSIDIIKEAELAIHDQSLTISELQNIYNKLYSEISSTNSNITYMQPNTAMLYVSIAIVCFLSMFIGAASSQDVNTILSKSTFLTLSGMNILYGFAIVISISGLSASFVILYEINNAKKVISLYAIMEGVTSGIIMAEIVYPLLLTLDMFADIVDVGLGKFFFAFLGGMTSKFIYNVITLVQKYLSKIDKSPQKT